MRPTAGAAAPIHDLGFVDLEAVIIVGRQTRRGSDSTIDVEHHAAAAADQVVVVVANAILVASNRTRWLNQPDHACFDEGPKCVVDGLSRDRSDLSPDVFGQLGR